jgi:uncharacterized protein YdaU (DUF1376 family)
MPTDDYALFKMCGADTKEEWASYKDQVMAKFKLNEGRWWHQEWKFGLF